MPFFKSGTDAYMGVFAAAGYADNGLCLEGNVEAVFAEYFTDNDAGFQFIVCCLQGVHGESPVQFQLFADVHGVAGVVHFRFDTAHFFVAHFHAHAAGIQFFNGFFHGGTDVAAHSLPVLFLQSLGNGEVLNGFFFAGGLDPEFQFRTDGEFDVFNVFEGNIFHAFDFFAAGQKSSSVYLATKAQESFRMERESMNLPLCRRKQGMRRVPTGRPFS